MPSGHPTDGRHRRPTIGWPRDPDISDALPTGGTDARSERTAIVDHVRALGVVLTALCTVGVALFLLSGGRWFAVETPSMGTAAPVGALVVTVPLGDREIRSGDIVTFRPPTSHHAWTHRVVEVTPDGGIRTRGDVNRAVDPWLLPRDAVTGGVVTVIPVAGWLLRSAPTVTLGLLCAWALTSHVGDRAVRGALRVLGVTVVVSVVTIVLRPLVDVRMLAAVPVDGGADATLVSAGVLPTRIVGDDETLRLTAGQVGTLVVPTGPTGHIALDSAVDLGPTGWLLLAALCCIPTVICLALDRARLRLS